MAVTARTSPPSLCRSHIFMLIPHNSLPSCLLQVLVRQHRRPSQNFGSLCVFLFFLSCVSFLILSLLFCIVFSFLWPMHGRVPYAFSKAHHDHSVIGMVAGHFWVVFSAVATSSGGPEIRKPAKTNRRIQNLRWFHRYLVLRALAQDGLCARLCFSATLVVRIAAIIMGDKETQGGPAAPQSFANACLVFRGSLALVSPSFSLGSGMISSSTILRPRPTNSTLQPCPTNGLTS